MAKVEIGGATLNTTRHTENFINWCKGFFVPASAETVLGAILADHKRREQEAGRKLNLDEFKARHTVNALCGKDELFRQRDGKRVDSIE